MRRLHFRSLIPNLITLSGLSFGLSSIRFAIEGEFNFAVICILFAAVCDVLDGMLARHLDIWLFFMKIAALAFLLL